MKGEMHNKYNKALHPFTLVNPIKTGGREGH